MTLPNFIIIGVIKGGTTSLYRYLREHPDIYMSPLKETRFFCFDPSDPEHVKKPFATFPVRTLEDYLRCFEGATTEKAIGEASPQYFRSPVAAQRIKEKIPDAKLIASLRNPVDQAYSGYLMAVRSGNEKRAVHEYFHDKVRSDSNSYYKHMKRFYDSFAPEQIKIVLLEDMIADTLGVVGGLFEFLGVNSSFRPDLSVRHNIGGLPKYKLLHRALRLKNKRLRMKLKPLLPDWLLDLRIKTKQRNRISAPRLPEDLRQEMNGTFSDDINRLEDLIHINLDVWRQ